VILLAGAGLLMRSFFVERGVELGFRPENLLTTQIRLPEKQYKTAELQTRFLRDLLPRLNNIPGVVSASGALTFPPFGGIDSDFEVAGKTHSEKWKGQMVLCSPEFFDTLRIRMLKGRQLVQEDVNGQRKVVAINQTLASKYFPGEDPIGKRIQLSALQNAPAPVPDPWFQIVGVIADIKNHGIRESVLPEVYAPYSFASYGGFGIFIRAAGNPAALVKAMDNEIWAIDKNVVPQFTNTMEASLDTFIFAKARFGLTLFSIFAAMGLILVSVGIYSVISYTVSQQSHEIGIRMALGATAANVRDLVIMTGLRFIFVGLGVGLIAAFILTRLLASQFWGVSSYDPPTMIAVVATLTLVGVAACYLPSRRATRVDPVISLRYE
jgi:putative ABC transport system permease protein